MNTIEKNIFGNNLSWFHLNTFEYNDFEKNIKINISPNNDKNNVKEIIFSDVKDIKKCFDNIIDIDIFPKSILGVESIKNKIVLSCTDGEYLFYYKKMKIL